MKSTNYEALCYAVFCSICLTSKKVHVQCLQLLRFVLRPVPYQVEKVVLYSLCGLTDSRRTNVSRPSLGDTSISSRHAVVWRCDTASVLQPTCWHNIVTSYSAIYPTRCNVTQFILSGKLLYMFRVVPPPIIRSANNCTYSIWHLSHSYCYLPLSWKSWNRSECAVGGVRHPLHTQTGSISSTTAVGSSKGVTNARYCRYSCLRS